MALRHYSGRGLLAVLVAGVLVAGCNPDPGTTPSGPPSPPASGGTPSPTPTENAQEREQREAFEAAEKAYRAHWEESGRLSMAGGVDEPTKILKDTSTGQYLDDTMLSLRGIKEQGLRASGPGKIEWVRPGAYGQDKLVLRTCEDYRTAVLTKKDGSVFTPEGTRVYDQTITVISEKGAWKLSEQDTTQVKTC